MTRPSPLKAACAAAGLTIRDVAAEVGCTAPVMYQVSTGRVEPWPKLRKDLADVFGYDPFAAGSGGAAQQVPTAGGRRGWAVPEPETERVPWWEARDRLGLAGDPFVEVGSDDEGPWVRVVEGGTKLHSPVDPDGTVEVLARDGDQ